MPAKTIKAEYKKQWPQEFAAWENMLYRCSPNTRHISAKYYAERGIVVCEQWKDFLVFLQDVGPRPKGKYHLDRIDGTRHYEPGNVRWAPLLTSYLNRRINGKSPAGCRFANGKWRARIKIKQKEINLGAFDSFTEAHAAYIQAKEQHVKTDLASSFVSG